MSAPTLEKTPNPFFDEQYTDTLSTQLNAQQAFENGPNSAVPITAPGSLGAGAMPHIQQEAFNAINGYDASRAKAAKEAEVYESRMQLGIASGSQRRSRKIGQRILADSPPEWLLSAVGGQDLKPDMLVDRLASIEKDAVDPATMTNVLEWYQSKQAERNQKFEQEVIAPMRGRFVERMQKAIDAGWVPADALSEERLEIIKNTPVTVDDETQGDPKFSGLLGSSDAYAAAGYKQGGIVYRNSQAKKRLKQVEATFTHEMVHMITGHTPEPNDAYRFFGKEVPVTKETYGMGRVFTRTSRLASEKGVDLNEAVTEHFAQALLDGDIEKITPNDMKPYMFQRYGLKALCTRGKVPVSPQLFVRAMMADSPHLPESSSRSFDDPEPEAITELRDALAEAFPGKDPFEMYNAALASGRDVGKTILHARRRAKQSITA